MLFKDIKSNEGMILYDRKVNRFIQVRKIFSVYPKTIACVCGGPTEYLMDAKTTISEATLSIDYINKNCERIICIDKCEHAECDSVGWRIKER